VVTPTPVLLENAQRVFRQSSVGQRHALPSSEKFDSHHHLIDVEFYLRRLPHWQPPGADFFVTWRLHGSLPRFRRHPSESAGAAFAALDQQLDRATSGPLWLKDAQVAECVSQTLLSGMHRWGLYELSAWVVMPNHVHVLLRPLVPLRKVLMNVKSGSARAANAVIGHTGKHFWQDESYDHWVRNDRERNSIIRYIHHNPVSAGLAAAPEDWPWSSAGWQRTALPHIHTNLQVG
jgi:REP element-mobilizing transposase RayT